MRAQYAVEAEELLERRYRLEPDPNVRARHSAAEADMGTALRRAAEMGDQNANRVILALFQLRTRPDVEDRL